MGERLLDYYYDGCNVKRNWWTGRKTFFICFAKLWIHLHETMNIVIIVINMNQRMKRIFHGEHSDTNAYKFININYTSTTTTASDDCRLLWLDWHASIPAYRWKRLEHRNTWTAFQNCPDFASTRFLNFASILWVKFRILMDLRGRFHKINLLSVVELGIVIWFK